MENLLTAQQVEELLKVNRITIYRMLNDGRLKGVKIGQQWRFPANQFDKLLTGSHLKSEEASLEPGKKQAFPTHCVQTIQNLFSDMGQITSITVDQDGNPLTEISHPTAYCAALFQSASGRQLCIESWKKIAQLGVLDRWLTCDLGMLYLKLPIHDEGEVIGFLLTGEFAAHDMEKMKETIHIVAESGSVTPEGLLQAYQDLPRADNTIRAQVESWGEQFIQAVESILRERAGLISRLQRIVEIGTV